MAFLANPKYAAKAKESSAGLVFVDADSQPSRELLADAAEAMTTLHMRRVMERLVQRGVLQIAAFTPTGPSGRVADGLLAALHLAGVTEVYRIGGVQAVGAMAFGTTTIPAVDKVYGPGNAYVCEAKRQVFGTVGVDSLPGPSEVMIIADDSANVSFAAADLLAQAEHGSGREKIYLLATSAEIINAINVELRTQLQLITRSEKTQRVLNDGFLAIEVKSLDQAADIANYVAPEHLELLVNDTAAKKLTDADIARLQAIAAELEPHFCEPNFISPVVFQGRLMDLTALALADKVTTQPPALSDLASFKVERALSWHTENLARNPSMKEVADAIHVSPAVQGYILSLVRGTRALAEKGGAQKRYLNFGASPRASLALYQAACALAWLRGADYLSPALVQEIFHDALRHRVGLTYEAEAEGLTSDKILDQVLVRTPVPAKV
mgnify:CR=1 FL=1